MIFIYNFYIIVIALTKIVWIVSSWGEFEDGELNYLSRKLNPIECMKLLEAMYPKRPITDEEYDRSATKLALDDESLLRRELENPLLSHENCRLKLEEWRANLPEKSNRWARVAMETVLRALGRPDLAKYIKRSRRIVEYLEGDTRLSRNTVDHPTVPRTIVSKAIRVTSPVRKYKERPKEAVVQIYRNPEEAKATRGKSILYDCNKLWNAQTLTDIRPETQGAHGARRSDENDTTTRWTAFFILLGLIALTILATALFAIYKKNDGRLFNVGDKNFDDCCPLADHSISDADVERGPAPSARCARRKRRGSSTQEASRSPSSICIRENCNKTRKPRIQKILNDRKQRNRRKRRCEKSCTGIARDQNVAIEKIDKSTKTKQPEVLEKSNQSSNPPKARMDIKKFHEKLANIMKKENPGCKCCKCSTITNEAKEDDGKNSGKKNICTDDKCQKRKMKNIADLCISSGEASTTKPSEGDSNRKKKKNKKSKPAKNRDKDDKDDKEKESVKTSPEISPRSKDKDSKKIEKSRKRRKCDRNEACTRKTCTFRKSKIEEDFSVNNNV